MNALHRDLCLLLNQVEHSTCPNPKWRLNYHLMPPVGWLNDPNGLCFYQGEYHFFFQYSPFRAEGGLKFWGYYKSKDLIHWDYCGVPLLPDQPYDCHGVYSGCAYTDGKEMRIYYTGNVKYSGDYDYIQNGRGSNTITALIQNGKAVQKECLMTNENYPENVTCHVRDPKVWKEKEKLYMILGARTKEEKGIALIYTSEDGKNWNLINHISTEKPFGYMWECPDLFPLQDHRILSVSPQGIEAQGIDFQNVYQSGYFFLEGDFSGEYHLSSFREWDRGFDFYAPQTFQDEKGRRILVGWMGIPDCEEFYTNPTTSLGWQHAFTLPREIIFQNGTLLQKPLEELQFLRKEQKILPDFLLCPSCFELILELENPNGLLISIEDSLFLEYNQKDQIFTLRFEGEIGSGRTSRSVILTELKKIHLFADTSSLEVFLNDGKEVFSTRYYPKENQVLLKKHCSTIQASFWELNAIEIQRKEEKI